MTARKPIAALVALALAVGCSIFEPRSPEDPDPTTGWQQPYTYPTVIVNLENVLEDLSADFYMLCFDTSFVFVADDQDTAQYAWNFQNWDYIQEQNAISLIIGEALADTTMPPESIASVTFFEPPGLPDPADYEDSIEIYRQYEIAFESSSRPPARGLAYLYLGKPAGTSGLWSIYRWDDNRLEDHEPDDNTWGVFKGFYLFGKL